MQRFLIGLLLFALGAGVGIGFTYLGSNAEIVALRRAAADSTAAAQHRDSAVTAYADSLQRRVDSLQRAKRPVTLRISQDSAAARTAAKAVRRAANASDSVVALVAQVASLESEVAGLRANAFVDALSLIAATARANALQDSLHAQTRVIADLNARIQRLNGHRLPQWARLSLKIVEAGFAVNGFVGVVHGR